MTTHDDKARELLPCPFCNAAATIAEFLNDQCEREWAVSCGKCDASIQFQTSAPQAIAAWNRRAALSPASTGQEAGLVERIARFVADEWDQHDIARSIRSFFAAPAQQVEAEIRDKALEEAARRLENAYFGCNDWHRLRQFAAEIRSLKSAAGSNDGKDSA